MNYQQIKQNFLSELKAASEGKKSSLSFIRNKLSPKPLVTNGTVQAIVVGGTNYISTISKISEAKTEILETKRGTLPVFKTEQRFGIFLETVLQERASAIGLNFAFPLDPVVGSAGQLDGILIRGTKEHTFEGLIGQSVGDFVSDIFFQKFGKQIPATVANDSICLTLSGNGTEDAGLIVGTGFNMSLKMQEIRHSGLTRISNRLNQSDPGVAQDDVYATSIINLEAGNFSGFDVSEGLKKIDGASEYPGRMLLEKTVSGKYLAEHFQIDAKPLGLTLPLPQTSKDLSKLAQTDQTDAGQLACKILEHSANLVASVVAGAYEFQNRPAKFEIITEGSLFWGGLSDSEGARLRASRDRGGWHTYLENVEKQLTELGVPSGTIKFKYIEESSLKGALGLLLR